MQWFSPFFRSLASALFPWSGRSSRTADQQSLQQPSVQQQQHAAQREARSPSESGRVHAAEFLSAFQPSEPIPCNERHGSPSRLLVYRPRSVHGGLQRAGPMHASAQHSSPRADVGLSSSARVQLSPDEHVYAEAAHPSDAAAMPSTG